LALLLWNEEVINFHRLRQTAETEQKLFLRENESMSTTRNLPRFCFMTTDSSCQKTIFMQFPLLIIIIIIIIIIILIAQSQYI